MAQEVNSSTYSVTPGSQTAWKYGPWRSFTLRIPGEEATCYLHRSALNPVLLVLQTSKWKQATRTKAEAGPRDPGCVLCGTAKRHPGWPLNCPCGGGRDESEGDGACEGPSEGASGGPQDKKGTTVNTKRRALRWASPGCLGGTDGTSQHALRNVSAMVFF